MHNHAQTCTSLHKKYSLCLKEAAYPPMIEVGILLWTQSMFLMHGYARLCMVVQQHPPVLPPTYLEKIYYILYIIFNEINQYTFVETPVK